MRVARTATWLSAAALVLNALVWGLSWWPFRALQDLGVHPLWATSLIYTFAVVCVLAVWPGAFMALISSPQLWLLALASGLTNIGFNWAVTIGDVVRVVLLFYLMPAWTVLLAWLLLGEKPSRVALARLVLAMLGSLLVLKDPNASFTTVPMPNSLPDYLALMGGFSFALTNVMLRRLKDSPSPDRMVGMFGGGALLSSLVALWGTSAGWVPALPAPDGVWLGIATSLALAFLVGNTALQYGAARLKATTTSLVLLSEIVFAGASSIALGAASLAPQVVWGGALILAAALWAALQD